ncbi:hypothetical protein [Ornithinimicrobium cryptoxanthini]|uniref:Uncharacterized protein n=1 Tax=Ornithinimicrobium cryptoxanthini TaxID=2934161 RepID=A0ABY4YKZ5_9MICO|nr:hypothetical protein [Ornithinimicrobium cryptoxanthini]USQ77471.1 hypothetical protein NF557_06040 [Ornithinimicrobium cryptoxanthini]
MRFFAPSYLSEVLPAARATYGGYDAAIQGLLANVLAIAALVTIVILVTGRRNWPPRVLLAVIGSLLAALLQGKGFNYHFLPSLLFVSVGVVLCWGSIESPSLREHLLKKVVLVAAVGSVILSVGDGVSARLSKVNDVDPLVAAINANSEPGDKVVVLATSPRILQPALWMSEAKVVGSTCCLFTLPQYQKEGTSYNFLSWQLEGIATDVKQYRPHLIILDHRQPQLALSAPFDYRDLLTGGLDSIKVDYHQVLDGPVAPDYVLLKLVE